MELGGGGQINGHACSGDGAEDGGRRAGYEAAHKELAVLLSQVGSHGPFSLQVKAESHRAEYLGVLMRFPISAPGLSTHTPSLSLLVGFGDVPEGQGEGQRSSHTAGAGHAWALHCFLGPSPTFLIMATNGHCSAPLAPWVSAEGLDSPENVPRLIAGSSWGQSEVKGHAGCYIHSKDPA